MVGTREALIVATGTYEDPELRRLRAPAQDAEALARVLADPAIGDFHVQSVVDQPARVVTRAAQQFFADRGLDDLLLVHLSCHGVKDDDGRLYFAARDTERKWLASTGVSSALMNDLMERCRARSIVLLLDCCYSGAFLLGAKGDEGVHVKEKFEGEGRAILTASNAIEYSWEGDELSGEGAPSLFTAAIVEGLETGEADRDRDGAVSVEDLYKHVYERVRAQKRAQTPKMWQLGIERDLYVARNPHPIEIQPAALPPELQAALESPLPSVRAGIVDDFSRLLRGTVPGLRVAAEEALKQLRDDDSRRVSEAANRVLEHGEPGVISAAPVNAAAESESEPRPTVPHPKAMEERSTQSAASVAKPAAKRSNVARVNGKPGGDPRWATVMPLLAGVLFLGYLVFPVSDVESVGRRWVTSASVLGALPLLAAMAFVTTAALLRTSNPQRRAFLNGLILASGLLVLALAIADLLSFAEQEFCGFTDVSVTPLLGPWSGAAGGLLSILAWHRRKTMWQPTEADAKTGRPEPVRAALAGGAGVLILLATVALDTCADSTLVQSLSATAIPALTSIAIAAWSVAAFLRRSSGRRDGALGVTIAAGTGAACFFLSLGASVDELIGFVPAGPPAGVLGGLLLAAAGWPRWTQRLTP